MQLGSPRIVRFGVFEVDLVAGELRRHGFRVKLQAQPFQVLAALLERPGEIVTKDELQERIWRDDTFVDFEDGLSTAVWKIRQALGDAATNSRFIETLPKRGYRFIPSVEAGPTIQGSASPPQTVTPTPTMSKPSMLMVAALLLASVLGGLLMWVLGEGESPRAYRRICSCSRGSGRSFVSRGEGHSFGSRRFVLGRDLAGWHEDRVPVGRATSAPLAPPFRRLRLGASGRYRRRKLHVLGSR